MADDTIEAAYRQRVIETKAALWDALNTLAGSEDTRPQLRELVDQLALFDAGLDRNPTSRNLEVNRFTGGGFPKSFLQIRSDDAKKELTSISSRCTNIATRLAHKRSSVSDGCFKLAEQLDGLHSNTIDAMARAKVHSNIGWIRFEMPNLLRAVSAGDWTGERGQLAHLLRHVAHLCTSAVDEVPEMTGGRPPDPKPDIVGGIALKAFELATGRRPTLITVPKPPTKRAPTPYAGKERRAPQPQRIPGKYGDFRDLLERLFLVLNIKASPDAVADRVTKARRNSGGFSG